MLGTPSNDPRSPQSNDVGSLGAPSDGAEYIATVKSAVGVNIEKQAASQTMKLQRFDFFVTLVCLAVFSLTLAGDQLNAAPQIGESTSKLSRKQLKEYEVEAHGLIRAGKEWDAEQTIIGHCKEIAKKYGEDSHEHAQMLYIQATVYAGMRNLESAIEALRRAGDIPGNTQQGKKDRLTYLMNLGEFLILTKKRDEAEKVLRKGTGTTRGVLWQGSFGIRVWTRGFGQSPDRSAKIWRGVLVVRRSGQA